MSVQALSLVNDLLRLQRLPAVTDMNFATEESAIVALYFVNEGIQKILNDKTWDFSYRHDGLMTTSPSFTGTVDITQNAQNFTIQTPTAVPLDYSNSGVNEVVPVRHLVMTGDATYPNTPWRIRQIQGVGHPTPGFFHWPWRGATATGAAYTMVCPEYVFPENVKDVRTASASETPIKIEAMQPSDRLDDWIPRPTETINDSPLLMAVGHSASPQVVGSSSLQDEGEVRLRGFLYPVPESRYPIQYTYTVRYPKLQAFNATLVGVRDTAIFELMQYALGQWAISPSGNDEELGRTIKREQRFSTREAMEGERRGTSARANIIPFSTRQGRFRDRRVGRITGL